MRKRLHMHSRPGLPSAAVSTLASPTCGVVESMHSIGWHEMKQACGSVRLSGRLAIGRVQRQHNCGAAMLARFSTTPCRYCMWPIR